MATDSHISLNGCSHWVATHGAGPPVVLLHGGPGMCDYLGPVAAMLDDVATTVRYDQRGCGRTDGTPPYDVVTYVADLDALRRHLGLERWALVGHSWGACLALAYAVAHPQHARAVVLTAGHNLLGRGPWSEQYHATMRSRLTHDERRRWDELKAALRANPRPAPAATDAIASELSELQRKTEIAPGTDPARFPHFPCPGNNEVNAALNADWRTHAGSEAFQRGASAVRAPVLAVHGAWDPRPGYPVEQYVRSLPNGNYRLIPAAGHYPWVEAPGAVAAALRSFLAASAARIGRP